MADDRSIAPDPARWRRAWQAGVRPQSRWLWPAVAMAGLAAWLQAGVSERPGWIDVRPGALPPADAWARLTHGLTMGWLVAGAGVLGVAILGGRLGPVSAVARRRLGAAPASSSVVLRLGLVALAGAVVFALLRGGLAGAARGVDASAAGLVALWWGWAARGSTALAIALGLAALGELLVDRHERSTRLRRTPQQVRDQARASGAG